MNVLCYDIEIEKAVPRSKDAARQQGEDYCEGWHDHANMGVACIGAMQLFGRGKMPRPRMFFRDNLDAFQEAAYDAAIVCGFNSIRFDDQVLRHNGVSVETTYDILAELWIAADLDPDIFDPATHGGFGLDATARANGIGGKTGHGATAPVDWQQGRRGSVVDYCMTDVWLTARLYGRIVERKGHIADPRDPTRTLHLRPPVGPIW